MFPDNIKDLYQGVAFDELCFRCIYCQLEFMKSESVDDLIEFHKRGCKVMRNNCSPANIPSAFFRGDYHNFKEFLKIENRVKTYNPFLFSDFKTVLQLAEAGFIFTGIDFSLESSVDDDDSYEDEEITSG